MRVNASVKPVLIELELFVMIRNLFMVRVLSGFFNILSRINSFNLPFSSRLNLVPIVAAPEPDYHSTKKVLVLFL